MSLIWLCFLLLRDLLTMVMFIRLCLFVVYGVVICVDVCGVVYVCFMWCSYTAVFNM